MDIPITNFFNTHACLQQLRITLLCELGDGQWGMTSIAYCRIGVISGLKTISTGSCFRCQFIAMTNPDPVSE